MHLSVEIDYETAADDDVLADLLDGFPECGKCGESLEYVQIEEPTEVLD